MTYKSTQYFSQSDQICKKIFRTHQILPTSIDLQLLEAIDLN